MTINIGHLVKAGVVLVIVAALVVVFASGSSDKKKRNEEHSNAVLSFTTTSSASTLPKQTKTIKKRAQSKSKGSARKSRAKKVTTVHRHSQPKKVVVPPNVVRPRTTLRQIIQPQQVPATTPTAVQPTPTATKPVAKAKKPVAKPNPRPQPVKKAPPGTKGTIVVTTPNYTGYVTFRVNITFFGDNNRYQLQQIRVARGSTSFVIPGWVNGVHVKSNGAGARGWIIKERVASGHMYFFTNTHMPKQSPPPLVPVPASYTPDGGSPVHVSLHQDGSSGVSWSATLGDGSDFASIQTCHVWARSRADIGDYDGNGGSVGGLVPGDQVIVQCFSTSGAHAAASIIV